MLGIKLPHWRAILWGALVAILGVVLLGTVFVFSGLYNVAASARHFDISNALIRLTLRRSVEMRSLSVTPPGDLSDTRLARLGARHFALGCAPCHASPVSAQSPVAAGMYPAPPLLTEAVETWRTEELFWIVRHGLKFTGMPSWPAEERGDEIWALVAFLERLPGMSERDYAALAGTELAPGAADFTFAPTADTDRLVAACENCHGNAESAPVHPLAPPLDGQKQPYLERSLREYAANRRQSGIMEAAAGELAPEAIGELARVFAEREAPVTVKPGERDTGSMERGAAIALDGVRGDDIPACRSCHSVSTSGQFPRLGGLPAEYIMTQLELFRAGVRADSVYAAIMAPIAARLSDEQIRDVAAYFAAAPERGEEAAAR